MIKAWNIESASVSVMTKKFIHIIIRYMSEEFLYKISSKYLEAYHSYHRKTWPAKFAVSPCTVPIWKIWIILQCRAYDRWIWGSNFLGLSRKRVVYNKRLRSEAETKSRSRTKQRFLCQVFKLLELFFWDGTRQKMRWLILLFEVEQLHWLMP